ncbi:MAG: hypothetical protein U0441_05210 [Polyangiaceae bacterium]
MIPSGPSSRNLAAIPAPERLRQLLRARAVLDILLLPVWSPRKFFFVANWGKHQLGFFRDHNGGWFLVLFTGPDAAVIKGFDPESAMAAPEHPSRRWPHLFDGIPRDMVRVKNSHAYLRREVTYCLWHPAGRTWTMGPVRFPAGKADPDGSETHLAVLDETPEFYVRFAKDIHEVKKVRLAAVKRVYAGEPLSWALVSKLAPDANPARVVREAEETGYPFTKAFLLRAQAARAEGMW